MLHYHNIIYSLVWRSIHSDSKAYLYFNACMPTQPTNICTHGKLARCAKAACGHEGGYPAPLVLDLKHYSVEQWGLKDPPQCDPFWLWKQKCAIWAVFCLPVRMGVFVNANWPTYRPVKWNTASQTHHAFFLLLSESKWYCGCGIGSHC